MKYNCSLIQDIAPLYHDHALSLQSREIVEAHLGECRHCADYYNAILKSDSHPLKQSTETENICRFSEKIRKYRLMQTGVFFLFVIVLLTMGLAWFGYRGISEIPGIYVLQHPVAAAAATLLLFGIWYPFVNSKRRMLCGTSGIVMLLAMEVFDFLTIPAGSTMGIQIGTFFYDIPNLAGVDIAESFQYALPGFYIGVAATIAAGIGFFCFCRKAK